MCVFESLSSLTRMEMICIQQISTHRKALLRWVSVQFQFFTAQNFLPNQFQTDFNELMFSSSVLDEKELRMFCIDGVLLSSCACLTSSPLFLHIYKAKTQRGLKHRKLSGMVHSSLAGNNVLSHQRHLYLCQGGYVFIPIPFVSKRNYAKAKWNDALRVGQKPLLYCCGSRSKYFVRWGVFPPHFLREQFMDLDE